MIELVTCPRCARKYKALLPVPAGKGCFWCESTIPFPIPAPSVDARNTPAFTPRRPGAQPEDTTDDDQ